MDKKDAKIEYELKSLSGENLPDADKILWKARVEMRKQAQSETSPQKAKAEKRKGWIFAVCGAVAAAFVVVILGFNLVKLLPESPDMSGGSESLAPVPDISDSPGVSSAGSFYSADVLSARRVTHNEAAAIFTDARGERFPLPEIVPGGEIVDSSITVFKNTQSDKDVLIVCKMRVMGKYGADELTLMFELTADTYYGNCGYLTLPESGEVRLSEARENGEYVSRAYIEDKYRCMLEVMNGNGYRLDFYLDLLFGKKEVAQ